MKNWLYSENPLGIDDNTKNIILDNLPIKYRTDKNINSDLLTVSSNVCVDLLGSISYTLTSASQPTFGENPNWTAEPTNPLPTIPIFTTTPQIFLLCTEQNSLHCIKTSHN